MIDFLRLCPKCKLHLRIQLEKDLIVNVNMIHQ